MNFLEINLYKNIANVVGIVIEILFFFMNMNSSAFHAVTK